MSFVAMNLDDDGLDDQRSRVAVEEGR